MSLVVLVVTVLVVLGLTLISHDAYTDMPVNFCYDEDMEGYICFDTLKMCESEQDDDLMAESECYED